MADEITQPKSHTIKIEKPKLLLGEGREEVLFFEALIDHLKLHNIQIMEIGGKDNLRKNLKALTKAQGFDGVLSLGIVRDADADADAAFQSVCDALKTIDLPTPERPLHPVGEKPRVGVLILPGEGKQGMLETLCLRAVEQDPAMHCVEQYFKCLQQEGLSLPDNMSKAKVHAFLASKSKAGLRLGEAAKAGLWPWEKETFKQVKDFLRLIAS
jgi:hypothetical protein